MNIQNTNLISQYFIDNQPSNQVFPGTLYMPQDDISLSKLEMSENLTISRGYEGRAVQFEGDINGKQSSFKYYYDFNKSKDAKNEYRHEFYEFDTEGSIGGKDIVLHQKSNHISGVYNNKNVELDISIDFKKKKDRVGYGANAVTLNGTIDNKPYSISLPNAEIPQDEDTRDIITSILALNWLAPFTVDNKIIKVMPSQSSFDRVSQHLESRYEKIEELVWKLGLPAVAAFVGGLISKFDIKQAFNFIKRLVTHHP